MSAMKPTPKQLATSVLTLLSLPKVFFRLEELLEDPGASFEEMGQVLSHDPGLATRLLKLVNSALYGFPSRIETLPRAIALIGIEELKVLVMATMVADRFRGIASELVDMSTFWHHSLYCALAARQLARRCRVLHPGRLFAQGLLHDVGQLVLYQTLPDAASRAIAEAAPTDDGLYLAERAVLGFSHGEVGAELFTLWGLPKGFAETAAFHHEPHKAQDFPLETAIVHLANSLANRIEPGRNTLTQCQPVLDPHALRLTGLDENVFDEIMSEVEAIFLKVAQLISPDAPLT